RGLPQLASARSRTKPFSKGRPPRPSARRGDCGPTARAQETPSYPPPASPSAGLTPGGGPRSALARQRAAELANDADLRLNPPRAPAAPELAPERTETHALPAKPDHRLPPPGTVLTRPYKGEVLQVLVLQHGFEYQGEVFKSLSAVAKAITG